MREIKAKKSIDEVVKIQKKLIELTERWIHLTGCGGKSGEPSISITLTNDMKWIAEIYSYMMDFHDGGRHHYFEGKSFDELIQKIWRAIEEEEEELKSVEEAEE